MSEYILQMRGITKDFPGVRALDNVDFAVREGEIHALVGENGAGKSTLMKILSGVYTDYQGQIILRGEVVRFHSTRDAERAGIAIIHQELNLVLGLSVAENVFLGREPARYGLLNWRKLYEDTRALFSKLDLDLDPRRLVRDCSVGQQQMVEIAKALSVNAKIIVMDEPTSALTEHEVETLFRIIRSLKERGVTVIYISHKLEEVFQIADTVTVLRDGKTVGTLPKDALDRQTLVKMMVGRELRQMYPERTVQPGKVIFEVRNWCAEHPMKRGELLLKNISFTLREGEILGIAGLMGAGRTELVQSIFGAYPGRCWGEIILDGKKLKIDAPPLAIKHNLALVPEDRKRSGLVLTMPVGKNITLASLDLLARFGVIKFKREREVIQKQVERLRIKTPTFDTVINNLSGGNQQKAVVGKWLARSPRILIMDEPTRGIDVGAKAEIYQIMNELTEHGISIIMVSSELPEILGMSDRILVLHEGEVAGILTRQQATQEEIMHLATGGE